MRECAAKGLIESIGARVLRWTKHRTHAGPGGPSVPHAHQESLNMVILRLTRGGANKRPFYHVVATDSRNRRDGRFIERLGFYNPIAKGAEEGLRIAMDRVSYWQGCGAQMSPTVARLVKDFSKKQAQPVAAA
jgi:small subunit ribosomal protein S16